MQPFLPGKCPGAGALRCTHPKPGDRFRFIKTSCIRFHALLDEKGKQILTAVTDENGLFSIDPEMQGNYTLVLTAVSYHKKTFPILVTNPKLVITLAAINPFSASIPQTVTMQSQDFQATVRNRYYLKAFKLTLNWEFGGLYRQKDRKNIINDDIKGQPKG